MKALTYSLFAAAAACCFASAQTTAYTTPVGYVTLDVPANSDTNIGQPLNRGVAFAGVATSVAGSVVNVAAGSLTENQFVYSSPTQPNNYYLLAVGGALGGRYFDVVSNTTSSLTLDNGAVDISGITNFKVIPYWTLGTLFPAGAGVGTTTDIFEPNGLVLFKDPAAIGVDRPTAVAMFHYTGTDEQGTGWYNNDDLSLGLQNDLIIDPSMVSRVRNGGAAKQVVVTGEVPASAVATPIATAASATDNYLAVQFPLDVTLAGSGLSAVMKASTDIFEPADLLLIYDDLANGVDKPASAAYFYYVGTDEAGTGWYNNDDLSLGLQDNMLGILQAGRSYTVRSLAGTPGTSYSITQPPYTL